MYHHYNDGDILARPGLVQLPCPDCPRIVYGRGRKDAEDLLAIHREAACQGREEVDGDGDGDPAPAGLPAADVPRLRKAPERSPAGC